MHGVHYTAFDSCNCVSVAPPVDIFSDGLCLHHIEEVNCSHAPLMTHWRFLVLLTNASSGAILDLVYTSYSTMQYVHLHEATGLTLYPYKHSRLMHGVDRIGLLVGSPMCCC